MSKEVIFYCGRYPSLMLTVKPFGIKDIQGNFIPAKHLTFGPDPVLGAGILKVKDEDMQKYVKNHEYFKNGKIIEVEDASDIPVVEVKEKVQTGVHDTRDVRTPSGSAPTDKAQPIRAAKIPRKKL